MRIPHMLFGIDPHGTAVVVAIMDLNHRDEPARSCTAHHYFDEFDKVGLNATCRRIGTVVLNVMRLKRPEALAPFDVVAATPPADRLPDKRHQRHTDIRRPGPARVAPRRRHL